MELTEEQKELAESIRQKMIQPSEEEVELQYKNLMEDIKGKTYLEILPEDLMKRKKGIIKPLVLSRIDKGFELLNSDLAKEYYPNGVSKEIITAYMMVPWNEYSLKSKIIKKPNYWEYMSEWMESLKDESLSEEDREKIREESLEKSKKIIELAEGFRYFEDGLGEYWQLIDRKELLKGDGYTDLEKSGFPRLGRGNICTSFYPIKNLERGLLGKHRFVTRGGKNLFLDIVAEDMENTSHTIVYKALRDDKKIVFLIDYDSCVSAYDALFDINKEINAGWWNKELKYEKPTTTVSQILNKLKENNNF